MEKQMLVQVKQQIYTFYEDNPFVQYLDIRVKKIEKGRIALEFAVKHEFTNVYKIAHGGALMSLADTAMGAACLSCNKKVVTLDFNMNLLKAVPEGSVVQAIGTVVHDGARTMVCECDLMNEAGQVLTKSRGTFFVLEKFVKGLEEPPRQKSVLK